MDGRCHPTAGPGNPDLQVRPGAAMAPVAPVGVSLSGLDTRDPPGLLETRLEHVPVIRIARQRLRADDKALLAGRDDADLHTEFVLLVGFALGDAFDLRGMHAVQLGLVSLAALSGLAV